MRYQDHLDLKELKTYADAMNRRARGLRRRGRITPEFLRSVILESGGKCAWCDENLVDKDFEIDHVLSLIQGGSNQVDNLAMTCPSCNRKKGEKHPARFGLEIAAQTGIKTKFVAALLETYDTLPTIQKSLFGDDTPQDTSAPIDLPDDEDTPPVEPYRW